MRIYNQSKKYAHEVPSDAVNISRGTPWGNPFVMHKERDRDAVIQGFKLYAHNRLFHNPDWLEPLRGKDLVCWCAPKPCHGDVLLELLENSNADN